MTAKIIVPVDFSAITPSVITWATSIARDHRAALVLVHVQEPIGENVGGEFYFPVPIHENPELRSALLALKPDEESVPFMHELLIGIAAEQILKAADDPDVQMIVMGSHGRTGLGRLLMGSVAETVLRRAHCPVLVVKPPRATCATQPDVAAAAKVAPAI